MAPIKRQGQNPQPPKSNTPSHHMTLESVKAMIDQALLRNSTNGDGSQSSHEDNPRNVQTTRPCFYADFMKCHPLNFKGNEGIVGLTRWIEKIEFVFNISGCAIENQTSISLPPEAEVERLLAMPTPSPSPITSLSPPSTRERLARCTAPVALPSSLLPLFSYLPPLVDRRDGIPESEQPPHKRLCLSTLGFRYEVGESSTRGRRVDYRFANTVEAEIRHRGIREVGYEIRDTWIDLTEAVPEMASTTLEKVNTKVTELAELYEHDT
nr:hypothetical protein [Tanacetum cinerariifolium]